MDTLATLRSTGRRNGHRPDDAGYDEARAIWNGMIDRRPAALVRAARSGRHRADHRGRARARARRSRSAAAGTTSPGNGTVEDGIVLDLGGLTDVVVDRTAQVSAWPGRDARPPRSGDRAARPRGPGRGRVGHRRRRADARWRRRLADATVRADRRQPARRGRRHGVRGSTVHASRRRRTRTCSGACAAEAATSASCRRSPSGRTRSGRTSSPGTFVSRPTNWADGAARPRRVVARRCPGPDDGHRDVHDAAARVRARRRAGHADRLRLGLGRPRGGRDASSTGLRAAIRPGRRGHRPDDLDRLAVRGRRPLPEGRSGVLEEHLVRPARRRDDRDHLPSRPRADWVGTGFDIHLMGGAFGRVAEDATPFPGRAARYWLNIYGYWADAADDAARTAFVKGFAADMAPHAGGAQYVNFLGRGIGERGAGERAGGLRPVEARAVDGAEARLRPGQRLPAEPQHPAGLTARQRRISTMSPSTTTCSRPTRWPSNRADGPQTRAPLKLAPRSWWTQSATSATVAPGSSASGSGVDRAVLPQAHPDQAGQRPHGGPERVERRLVEHRHAQDAASSGTPRQTPDGAVLGLVGARRREEGRLLDAGLGDLVDDDRELGRIGARPAAVDDRVDRPQHAEQRPAAAPVVGRTADQPGDLDELDEDAADPGQRRHRPERRERVVAGLDLDLGQGLEQRRLADVRRTDERDLRRALASDRDRIAVDGVRPDAGVLDLGQEPFAQVRVRTVLVVGQLREQRVDLADPSRGLPCL